MTRSIHELAEENTISEIIAKPGSYTSADLRAILIKYGAHNPTALTLGALRLKLQLHKNVRYRNYVIEVEAKLESRKEHLVAV